MWPLKGNLEKMTSLSVSEPSHRAYHFSAAIHRQLFVYGGDLRKGNSELPSVLYSFSLDREQWWKRTTTGQHPPLMLSDSPCISEGNHFYLFGGSVGRVDGQKDYYNNLYQLDCNNFNWALLSSIGGTNAPVAKTGCGMVYYSGKIVIFGGYCGQPTGPTQPGAEYEAGKTNEIHQYNLEEGEGDSQYSSSYTQW